ncbi:expressed unknown protein [Seminavis robusta]|uniref:Uncharacterized protein n=1 Tax=Seminavis robusta TaxID=568900 RepID=A0A9N8E211_9STRA|nr:expressed unknown protein [Seminavis robusta]|eukprot:Sro569_g168320.1 n/a (127) ;mRNA; r:19827-20619
MDTFLIGQVAFWWAQYSIKPAVIVDKLIEIAVDILVPPRQTNQNSGSAHGWFMSRWNSLDRAAEKTQRELEIRNDLRRWDRDNPEMRHEIIVRTIVSGMVSVIATNVYISFCRRIRGNDSRGGRYH